MAFEYYLQGLHVCIPGIEKGPYKCGFFEKRGLHALSFAVPGTRFGQKSLFGDLRLFMSPAPLKSACCTPGFYLDGVVYQGHTVRI